MKKLIENVLVEAKAGKLTFNIPQGMTGGQLDAFKVKNAVELAEMKTETAPIPAAEKRNFISTDDKAVLNNWLDSVCDELSNKTPKGRTRFLNNAIKEQNELIKELIECFASTGMRLGNKIKQSDIYVAELELELLNSLKTK